MHSCMRKIILSIFFKKATIQNDIFWWEEQPYKKLDCVLRNDMTPQLGMFPDHSLGGAVYRNRAIRLVGLQNAFRCKSQ